MAPNLTQRAKEWLAKIKSQLGIVPLGSGRRRASRPQHARAAPPHERDITRHGLAGGSGMKLLMKSAEKRPTKRPSPSQRRCRARRASASPESSSAVVKVFCEAQTSAPSVPAHLELSRAIIPGLWVILFTFYIAAPLAALLHSDATIYLSH